MRTNAGWLCWLLCFIALTGAGAQAPLLGIAGTWQTDDASWTVSPQRLRLTAPGDKVGRTYVITAKETLPADEWTISFTTIQYHDISHATIGFVTGQKEQPDGEFRLEISPENSRADVKAAVYKTRDYKPFSYGYQECCAGAIHQVRMAYQANTKRFSLVINGQPVDLRDPPPPLPTGPVTFQIKLPNGLDKPFTVDVVDIRVQKGAVFPETRPQAGPAYDGWNTLAKPAAGAVPADFGKRMHALYGTPEFSEAGRAYVLAAYAIYERAANGQLSENTWKASKSLYEQGLQQRDFDRKNYGLDVLGPIWLASSSPAQRTAAQPTVDALFAKMFLPYFRVREETVFTRRALLLDPARTVETTLHHSPGFGLNTALLNDEPGMTTDRKLALYCGLISHDTRQLNAYAWLLPDIQQAAPAFGLCVKHYLLELANRRDTVFTQELDVPLALAAYRVAPTDLRSALALCESIQTAGTRADVYEVFSTMPAGKQIPDLLARTEGALQVHITQWKRLRHEQSPVRRYLRLANWYLAQGREADALQVVKAAIPKIATENAQATYADTSVITTFYRKCKHPDAQAWLAKMADAATAADQDTVDRSDGWVHISATNSAVRALVQEGKINEAVALVEKLDEEMLPENIANCYAIIIYALAKTDMPRALTLLKRVPPVRQRDSIVQGIAPRLTVEQARALLGEAASGRQKTAILGAVVPVIARANLTEALALLKAMPPADRREAIYGLAAVMPLERNPELLQLTLECIPAYLKQTVGYSRDARMTFFNTCSTLTPTTLMALEPAFAEDRELYARIMVNAMANACNLSTDPLWQRFADIEWGYRYNPIYWGGTVFTEAVRSYTENMNKPYGMPQP